MKRKWVLLVLSLFLVLVSQSISSAAFPGIPKGASLLYSVAIPEKGRAPIDSLIEKALAGKEVARMTEMFERETKVPFPKAIITSIKSLARMDAMFVADKKNAADFAIAGAFLTFNDEKTAGEVLAAVKATVAGIDKKAGKKTEMIEAVENGVKTMTSKASTPKDELFKLISDGRTVGLISYKSGAETEYKNDFNSITASFKNEKEAISSMDRFKNAWTANENAIKNVVYFNSDFVEAVSRKDRETKDMKEFIEAGVTCLTINLDLSKAALDSVIVLKTPVKKEALQVYEAAKKILSGQKLRDFSACLPSDIATVIALKINASKEMLDIPEMAAFKGMTLPGGISLENDVLSWFNGNIFMAAREYNITDEQLKNMSMDAGDSYIGLGCDDYAKASELVKKLRALVPQGEKMPFKMTDEKISGIDVISVDVPGSPFKDMSIKLGYIGKNMILALTRNAFEKAASAAGKPQTSLAAEPEFKSSEFFDKGSFFGFYLNMSRVWSVIEALGKKEKVFKELKAFEYIKHFTLAAGLNGNELSISIGVSADPKKLTLESLIKNFQIVVKEM